MSGFREYKFIVPELWKHDWHHAISNAEGMERRILVTQQKAASMVEVISDRTATPERMAWMTMWTRSLAAAGATLAAQRHHSEFMLNVLSRVCFEAKIQAYTIIE